MRRRVVFLHIPKTAGQSVHATLTKAYGEDAVAPIRVNAQLDEYPISYLSKFDVFSGHFDWDKLDFVPAPKLYLTILREPADRIASFYLYLRQKSLSLTEEDLARPEHAGLRAARELDVNDYFANPNVPVRGFIDDHYDNFYTFYFAGRNYQSRTRLRRLIGTQFRSESDLVDRALDNMSAIDCIGFVDNLYDLSKHFHSRSGVQIDFNEYKANQNKGLGTKGRFEMLEEIGLTVKARDRIMEFCHLDQILYDRVRRNLENTHAA